MTPIDERSSSNFEQEDVPRIAKTFADGLREASNLIKRWSVMGSCPTESSSDEEEEEDRYGSYEDQSSISSYTSYHTYHTEANDSLLPRWESTNHTGPLLDDFVDRIYNQSRSGQPAVLRVEAALEALHGFTLTPDRAAKIISKFMRHAYARIALDKNDIQYYEREIVDIKEDTRSQLQEIQQYLQREKRKIAMEYGVEVVPEELNAEMEQSTKQVAREKVQYDRLKKQMKEMVHENANLSVLDPSQGDKVNEIQQQVERLTRYREQLTGFQAKYKAQVDETKRKLNLYKYARRDRRDQRKRCENYIQQIIQLAQNTLEKDEDTEELIRIIKEMKKENERQHHATQKRRQSIRRKSMAITTTNPTSTSTSPNCRTSRSSRTKRSSSRTNSSRTNSKKRDSTMQRRHSSEHAKRTSSKSRLRKCKTFDATDRGVQEANQRWNQSFSSATNQSSISKLQRSVTWNSEDDHKQTLQSNENDQERPSRIDKAATCIVDSKKKLAQDSSNGKEMEEEQSTTNTANSSYSTDTEGHGEHDANKQVSAR